MSSSFALLFAQDNLPNYSLEFILINTFVEPTNNISIRLEVFGVAYELHGVYESRGDGDVGKSYLIVDEESFVFEVGIEGGESLGKVGLGLFVTVDGWMDGRMDMSYYA